MTKMCVLLGNKNTAAHAQVLEKLNENRAVLQKA